jgi:hypothetical protein
MERVHYRILEREAVAEDLEMPEFFQYLAE